MKPLSALQQTILQLAWDDPALTACAWMVRSRFYHFPIARNGRWSHSVRFNRREIGVGRYTMASAAITVSFQRLVGRGLATEIAGAAGIRLTRAGVIAAISITKEQHHD